MESIGNYWFFWTLYLVSAVIFTAIFWRVTRFETAKWTSYNLRAVAIAIIFTPWYSNPQDSIMAPALMVAALDAITGGFEAALRSFVPLFLAVILGLLVAGPLSFLRKKKFNKSLKNKSMKKEPKATQ